MGNSDKRPEKSPESEAPATKERRRLSRVVHDHKGNATVQWHDAPADYVRPVLEIEGARQAQTSPGRGLKTGSLALATDDSHDPYTRVPDAERKPVEAGGKTDLRKLSAWIKLMRKLEEKKRSEGNEED
jgi:hypothetical protein